MRTSYGDNMYRDSLSGGPDHVFAYYAATSAEPRDSAPSPAYTAAIEQTMAFLSDPGNYDDDREDLVDSGQTFDPELSVNTLRTISEGIGRIASTEAAEVYTLADQALGEAALSGSDACIDTPVANQLADIAMQDITLDAGDVVSEPVPA